MLFMSGKSSHPLHAFSSPDYLSQRQQSFSLMFPNDIIHDWASRRRRQDKILGYGFLTEYWVGMAAAFAAWPHIQRHDLC